MLVERLSLEKDLYKKITKISYSEHIPLQKLINDMLKEYLNVYVLSKKINYALISKEVLKITFGNTPDDQVIELSKTIATRYREAAILLHGKPSLEAYICLIKSFVNANGYYMEFSKSSAVTEQTEEDLRLKQEPQEQQVEQVNDNNNDTFDDKDKKSNDTFEVMIIRFNISYMFSRFLGNVYRILLEEFCTINRFEVTETLAFYEYTLR